MKKVKFGKPVRIGWGWSGPCSESNMDKEYHTPPHSFRDNLKGGKSNKKICTVKGY